MTTIATELQNRAENACELCTATSDLSQYEVGPSDHIPSNTSPLDTSILICSTCAAQLDAHPDTKHWQCLNTCMWSSVPAVQVLAWRMLNRLSTESWAQDLLDMMYLDENLTEWARAGIKANSTTTIDAVPTRDSNGSELAEGDTVTLIKDLQVKGAGFTAKRGTVVRGIRLTDDPKHIEGKVSGQQIVLVSAFLKKVV